MLHDLIMIDGPNSKSVDDIRKVIPSHLVDIQLSIGRYPLRGRMDHESTPWPGRGSQPPIATVHVNLQSTALLDIM